MKKQLTNKAIYQPNGEVKVTVTNKPVPHPESGDIIGYDVDVTVKVTKKCAAEQLVFKTDDDIADFMGTVEYDDPQQTLALGDK